MDQSGQGRRGSGAQLEKSSGSPRRLSTEERRRIPGLLERGAESFGLGQSMDLSTGSAGHRT